MANIYIKWAKIHDSAQRLSNSSKILRQVESMISSVDSSLILSENLAIPIKRKLKNEIESIEKIDSSLRSCSSALNELGLLYKNTELKLD